MVGVVTHLQKIDIVVTAMAEVDVGYLGALNIVVCRLLIPALVVFDDVSICF